SMHAGDLYAGWREYLISSLIGTREIAESNLTLLAKEEVGIVYPEHAEYVKPIINWGYNFDIAKSILKRIGVCLDVNTILEFPSGSMYWAKSDFLKPLLDLNLSYEDFPEECGQTDGTLAHAI